MLSFWSRKESQRKLIHQLARSRRKSRIRRLLGLPGTLEHLEDRSLLTSFSVLLTTDDNSPGTLRNAIEQANNNPGPDTIVFDTATFGTSQTIKLAGTSLPDITDSLTITGPGETKLTIDGDLKSRIFNIDDRQLGATITVSISGLKMTRGSSFGENGGAIFTRENLTLSNVVISDSKTVRDTFPPSGGGLYADLFGGTLTIENSTISGNTTQQRGGGVYIHNYSNNPTTIIRNTTFSGNSATGDGNVRGSGGGLSLGNDSGTQTVINCTISGNQAEVAGGGEIFTAGGATILESLTVAGNSALKLTSNDSGRGGGLTIAPQSGTTTVRNTIISGNTATVNTPDVFLYGVPDISFSLIGDNSHSLPFFLAEAQTADSKGNLVGTAAAPINPLLGALAANGGPTQTRELLTGSRAKSAGTTAGTAGAPLTDQRGEARPTTGKQDMGAFQSKATSTPAPGSPTNLTLDPTSDSGTPGDRLTNDTTPTITGKTDAGTTVELFDMVGQTFTSLGKATASGTSWSITATALGNGVHTLVAIASDATGQKSPAPSSPLEITIDNVPPNAPTGLTLSPASDSGTQGDKQTNDTTPTITGQAEAGTTVTLKEGNTIRGTGTVTGDNWSITPSTVLSDGLHTFTAIATDAAGNASVASTGLDITIKSDTVDTTAPDAPTDLKLDPASDSGTLGDLTTSDTTPTITGVAEADSTVKLLEGGTVIGTAQAIGGVWSITPTTALTADSHTFTATATDAANNVSKASVSLTVQIVGNDTTPPGKPTNLALDPSSDTGTKGDGQTTDSTPTITGVAEADSSVKLFDGASLIGTATATGGTWSITPTTALKVGSHSLTATATDAAGNVSPSSDPLAISIVGSGDTLTLGQATPPSLFQAPTPNNSIFVVDTQAGVLDTFLGAGSVTVNLSIDRYFGDVAKLRASGLLPATVKLQLPVFDVDSNGQPTPETDRISVNGHSLSGVREGEFLTGTDGSWRLNTFTVPIEFFNLPVDPGPNGALVPVNNQIKIEVDTANAGWQTSIDWVSVKIEAPNPVYLVHGLTEGPNGWNAVWKPQLTNLGIPVGIANFWDNSADQTLQPIDKNAKVIASGVTELQRRWGFDNITIVAQSKGGLDARQYVEDLLHDGDQGNDDLVSSLIQIGTPNGGTSLYGPAASQLLSFAAQTGLQDVLKFTQIAGVPELSPEYLATYNLLHAKNPNTTYWSLAGIYNPPASDVLGQFLKDLSPGKPDDTLVTAESAWTTIDVAHRLKFESSTAEAAHLARPDAAPGQVRSQGIFDLLLPVVLRSNLKSADPFSGGGATAAPPIPAAPSGVPQVPDTMPSTEAVTGFVLPFGDSVREVVLDGGQPAYVSLLYYLKGSLELTLTTPSGVEVKPTDPGVEFDEMDGDVHAVIYKLAATEGGKWKIKVHNKSLLPIPFVLNGWFPKSTLTVSAQVDKIAYSTGDAIQVSAKLSDSTGAVGGATVEAQVFDPDYSLRKIGLFDDGTSAHGDAKAGDGIYSNLFTETTKPGLYQIIVQANGTAPTQFSRQEQTVAEVSAAGAKLKNTFTESAVDTNNNILKDQLIIRAAIDVAQAGFYRLFGDLSDATGMVIGQATFAGNLKVSDKQVDLVFDGGDIFESGANGPYKLSTLRLAQDSNGLSLLAQELSPTFQTAAYKFSDFEHGPLAALGIKTEKTIDTSSPQNGKFDKLEIGFEVSVAIAGKYNFSARLEDAQGKDLGMQSGSASLVVGSNVITLSFDGMLIGANKSDGNYHLTDFVLASDIEGLSSPQQFLTKTYQARQFEGFPASIPTNLNLVDASDTGNSSSDNFTGVATPTLTVQADTGPDVIVEFQVNGQVVTASETTPGLYSATLPAGLLKLGPNEVTATASNSAGTSPHAAPLTIQLAAIKTTTVETGKSTVITQADGTQVTIEVKGKTASAVITTLANDQAAEIVDISFKTLKKASDAALSISATGAQGVVNTLNIATAALKSLTLNNVSVGTIQSSGSITTLTLSGTGAITKLLDIKTNLTTLSATQNILSAAITVGGNLGTAKFKGAVTGAAITVGKNIKLLDFAGDNNLSLKAKKVTLINSLGKMSGTYRATAITTIKSTGAFTVDTGTTKISKKLVPVS